MHCDRGDAIEEVGVRQITSWLLCACRWLVTFTDKEGKPAGDETEEYSRKLAPNTSAC